jgi:hypothetical protein
MTGDALALIPSGGGAIEAVQLIAVVGSDGWFLFSPCREVHEPKEHSIGTTSHVSPVYEPLQIFVCRFPPLMSRKTRARTSFSEKKGGILL